MSAADEPARLVRDLGPDWSVDLGWLADDSLQHSAQANGGFFRELACQLDLAESDRSQHEQERLSPAEGPSLRQPSELAESEAILDETGEPRLGSTGEQLSNERLGGQSRWCRRLGRRRLKKQDEQDDSDEADDKREDAPLRSWDEDLDEEEVEEVEDDATEEFVVELAGLASEDLA